MCTHKSEIAEEAHSYRQKKTSFIKAFKDMVVMVIFTSYDEIVILEHQIWFFSNVHREYLCSWEDDSHE